MALIPWPMNELTKEAGQSRKLCTIVQDITPRSNIRPDNGKLRIIDVDRIKLCDCTVYPEIKEQGYFYFYCRDMDGIYHFYSKRQNVLETYTDSFHKIEPMKLPGIPCGCVIAGELIWPNHPDSEVPTAIKECPEELAFIAFGVPIYANRNLTELNTLSYTKSRSLLKNIFPPEAISKTEKPIELGTKFETAVVLEKLLAIAKEKKIEGWVLKAYGYRDWYKLKGLQEADVFITDFKISKSDTQYGLVTSVNIACFDNNKHRRDMGSVTGFSIEQKEELTKEYERVGDSPANKFIGKVLRVVYQELAGKGKLKHGFFDGWRDDKSFHECSISQFE